MEIDILEFFQVLGEGNSLFRAISFCLFKNSKQHEIIREDAVKFVIENWNEFTGFMSGYLQNAFQQITSMVEYENTMSKDDTHGGPIEIHATSKMYNN